MWILLTVYFVFCNGDKSINDWYPMGAPEPHMFMAPPAMGGWTMSERAADLVMLEAPIQVHIPMRMGQVQWNCVATHSPGYMDAITIKRPSFIPPEEHHTSYHRFMCILNGLQHFYKKVLGKGTQMEHEDQLKAIGIWEHVLDMNEFMEVQDCMGLDASEHTECLRQTSYYQAMDTTDKLYPLKMSSFTGAYVAAHVLHHMKTDCWNFDGSQNPGCGDSANPEVFQSCAKYADTTGYSPVNTPSNLIDETRWQPLTENDMMGFVYTQEHVTPQIGRCKEATPGAGVTNEMLARQAPDPEYDLDAEMELTFQRVGELSRNSTKQALVKIMDNKLLLAVGLFGTMGRIHRWSLENLCLFFYSFIRTERDAVVVTWKEKTRWDKIRPTSYAQHVVEEKEVTWYDGTTISTKVWQPFIRVMPHAEYPSGSAAICTAVAEFTKEWMKDKDLWPPASEGKTELASTWTAPAGSAGSLGSYGQDGMPFPKEDITVTLENMDQWARVCGESRLWGGMHFTASVKAAEDLVEGFGRASYELVKHIVNGQYMPQGWETADPDRILPRMRSQNDIDVEIDAKSYEVEVWTDRRDMCQKLITEWTAELATTTDAARTKELETLIKQREYSKAKTQMKVDELTLELEALLEERPGLPEDDMGGMDMSGMGGMGMSGMGDSEDNMMGGAGMPEVLEQETSGSSKDKVDIGPILGGIFGGVIGLALIIVCVYCIRAKTMEENLMPPTYDPKKKKEPTPRVSGIDFTKIMVTTTYEGPKGELTVTRTGGDIHEDSVTVDYEAFNDEKNPQGLAL